MDLNQQPCSTARIPLNSKKIIELFNAPRPDKNYADHAGPATLRVVFILGGRRMEVVLPILLQPTFVGSTQYIQLVGSKTFTLE